MQRTPMSVYQFNSSLKFEEEKRQEMNEKHSERNDEFFNWPPE